MKYDLKYICFIAAIYFVALFPLNIYGEGVTNEIKTVNYNGRIIKENHLMSKIGDIYIYEVDNLVSQKDSIQKNKSPFRLDTKYTIWYDQILMHNQKNAHKLFALNQFEKKGNESATNLITGIDIILDDTGFVICYDICSKESLLDLYTAEDILNIFDSIGTFRYTVPIVRVPQTGYVTMDLM